VEDEAYAEEKAKLRHPGSRPSIHWRVLHALNVVHVTGSLAYGLTSMAGLLQHLRANGFDPMTIIDVGAFVGDWTTMAASVFPSANVVMIEGNPDNEQTLRTTQCSVGARVRLVMGLLGAKSGQQVTFYKHGSGSSVFEELTSYDKTTIELQTTTLDTLMLRCSGASPAETGRSGFRVGSSKRWVGDNACI
jgi:FkbM family methyltransferase